MDIAVIGAGIIGLTSALRLGEAGHRVTVYAREHPPHTTSDRAAAIWWPDLAADPSFVSTAYRQRVLHWARHSWEAYRSLAGQPEYGIRPERCHIFYAEQPEPPLAAEIVPFSRLHHEPHLPGGLAWHWEFDSLLINMARLMPQLVADCRAAGHALRHGSFTHLDELLALDADLVVNCTGLGSRELCPDPDLVPIRGQLLHLRPQPVPYKLTVPWNGRSIYWMARDDVLILGGSYEPGVEETEPTPDEIEAIWQAHQSWLAAGAGGLPAPALRREDILGAAAGIRPHRRHGVRLELEWRQGRPVVHNYGHGGCGISLAWGCAAEVVALVEAL
ncbi:FAD-binding oxidoreductase [Litorilinea aerophila]|uniref:D-amino-acid oxidase n=1 Tax=Litorilinea aerophila TaxID=1204385 RepID=A0A540VKH9_9CHLR|nr:FAD-dependent oxidoreductase [Litorilinea aerophila]MCC9075333.1 FAD-binding oxidoreductase [Litorilinea aerophila]OUC08356.1 hypothetical protein RY27_09485 [Litorilinea aerophila]